MSKKAAVGPPALVHTGYPQRNQQSTPGCLAAGGGALGRIQPRGLRNLVVVLGAVLPPGGQTVIPPAWGPPARTASQIRTLGDRFHGQRKGRSELVAGYLRFPRVCPAHSPYRYSFRKHSKLGTKGTNHTGYLSPCK